MALDPSTELMLRVRDGDAQAFEQLVALWQDRLVTLFLHHTGDHATAEDLAQEVFLRVYRARATYKPTAKFTTWVHTIAHNAASDLRQRAYRRRERGVPMSTSASSSAIGLEQIAIAASGVLPTRQGNHFYGLFRSPEHQVVTQRLREWDVALIQLLQQQPGITQAAFLQQVQQVRSDFDLSEWARHFHRLGLLTLPVGERQPSTPLPSFSKHQGEFP